MDRTTEEALCDLQAQAWVLRLALRALARTHPDPGAYLTAWRETLAEVATTDPGAPIDARHSEEIIERSRSYAEDWTAELVELAVPGR